MRGFWNKCAKMYEVKCDYYMRNGAKVNPKKKRKEKTMTVSKCSTVDLWHDRFGHLNNLPDVCEVNGAVIPKCGVS